MMRFVKQISNFKWAWQSKYKLAIEAEMTEDELNKFLEKNSIVAETKDVDRVEIVIVVKGIYE